MKKTIVGKELIVFVAIVISLFAFSIPQVSAKPIGGQDRSTCCCDDTDATTDCTSSRCATDSGGSFISQTEGNLGESYSVFTVKNASGPVFDFTLFYNSYLADGSQASMNTIMGTGWTHSYNIFLVEQRRQIFKIGPTGRTAKFRRGPGGTYLSTQGHHTTLVKNPGGSFTLTLKEGTRYNFQKIIPAPFFFKSTPWMLTSVIDRNGNTTTLQYNGDG
ncbi:MAG: hypothetical protein KAV87_18225, partial [Desulfobacteraceae bacterium]|nr:hypothetical protein [Desulfobacteraceae bacterium]